MRYMGGKVRIAKELSVFLNEQLNHGQPFVDLFCGSCNIIIKIDSNRLRIANDKHFFLIKMWQAIQKDWIPPMALSEFQYNLIRENLDLIPHLSGFVGFGCSYSGKWFGGYAKDNTGRDYCLNAHNSTMLKAKKLKDVKFYNADYSDIIIPDNSLVYCDIPYKNTTPYKGVVFNHDEFYSWVKLQKSRVLISEYKHNVPEGFKVIWEKDSRKDMGMQNKTTEVLFECE